ncbi:MAG: prenyltransferase [Paludibacteraceae bacterium]|nr:prenyltransferase [Paludibacteraceae bacterium]
MNTLKRYFIATRPWSFPVSIAPVLLTTFYMCTIYQDVNTLYGFWALVGIVLFHAAGNMFSDYWDYKKGVDTEQMAGGSIITSGAMSAQQVLVYALVVLAVAVLNGLALTLCTGWQLLLIGGIGAVLAMAYPWLKFHALGDLDILFTFGIIPTLGTAFVMTGEIVWSSLWITPTFATITVAVLHANNTRDVLRDGNADIKTFAMLIGPRMSRWLYYMEVWTPLLWVIVCVATGHLHWIMIIVSLMASVVAFRNTRIMAQWDKGGKIDMLDQMTAQQQIVNVLMLTLGFLVLILW